MKMLKFLQAAKSRRAAVFKGERRKTLAGCKWRLAGCRLAARGMKGPSSSGCRLQAQVLEPGPLS